MKIRKTTFKPTKPLIISAFLITLIIVFQNVFILMLFCFYIAIILSKLILSDDKITTKWITIPIKKNYLAPLFIILIVVFFFSSLAFGQMLFVKIPKTEKIHKDMVELYYKLTPEQEVIIGNGYNKNLIKEIENLSLIYTNAHFESDNSLEERPFLYRYRLTTFQTKLIALDNNSQQINTRNEQLLSRKKRYEDNCKKIHKRTSNKKINFNPNLPNIYFENINYVDLKSDYHEIDTLIKQSNKSIDNQGYCRYRFNEIDRYSIDIWKLIVLIEKKQSVLLTEMTKREKNLDAAEKAQRDAENKLTELGV